VQAASATLIIYWQRELPPLGADAADEHVVEATSSRVPGTLLHRDELWNQCYEQWMAKIEELAAILKIVPPCVLRFSKPPP